MIKAFNIRRLVVMIGLAKSLSWRITTEKECRTVYFSIHKVVENSTNNKGYGIIIGPFTIMLGISD